MYTYIYLLFFLEIEYKKIIIFFTL